MLSSWTYAALSTAVKVNSMAGLWPNYATPVANNIAGYNILDFIIKFAWFQA
jgi:hypothetical protein